MRRSWASTVVCGCALLVGCGRSEPSANDTSPAPPVVIEPRTPTQERGPYLSTEAPIAPRSQPVATAVAQFKWSAEPRAEACPEQPVTGRLNGRDFICRYASLAPDEEEARPTYRLRFSSKPRGDLCSMALDDDAVTIEWHEPTGPGEWHRALAEPRPEATDAWFVLEQRDGTTYTGSRDWAGWLKIETQVGSTEPGGVPSVTGRLILCFDDEPKSWIAGTFIADGCAE